MRVGPSLPPTAPCSSVTFSTEAYPVKQAVFVLGTLPPHRASPLPPLSPYPPPCRDLANPPPPLSAPPPPPSSPTPPSSTRPLYPPPYGTLSPYLIPVRPPGALLLPPQCPTRYPFADPRPAKIFSFFPVFAKFQENGRDGRSAIFLNHENKVTADRDLDLYSFLSFLSFVCSPFSFFLSFLPVLSFLSFPVFLFLPCPAFVKLLSSFFRLSLFFHPTRKNPSSKNQQKKQSRL